MTRVSGRTAALTPDLERRLWTACSSVPGVHLNEIDIKEEGDGLQLVFELAGWSPVLHETVIRMSASCDAETEALTAAARGLLAPVLDEQRRRADDALLHGIGLPARTFPLECIGAHLHADATHLAFAIHESVRKALQDPNWSTAHPFEGDPMDDPEIVTRILKDAAKTVSLSHNGDARPYDGGDVIYSSGCVARQRTDIDGSAIRSLGMSSTTLGITGGRLSIGSRADGSTEVRVPQRGLPDTAASALAGRRFSAAYDLPAPLHAHLGMRTIANAHVRNDDVILTLEPLDAPFARLTERTPRDALAFLADLVSG